MLFGARDPAAVEVGVAALVTADTTVGHVQSDEPDGR